MTDRPRSLTAGSLPASIREDRSPSRTRRAKSCWKSSCASGSATWQSGDGQVDQAAVAYFNSALSLYPREFKPILGADDYALTVRFESRPEEKLFGMGQYQHGFLNQKNCRAGIGATQFASVGSLRAVQPADTASCGTTRPSAKSRSERIAPNGRRSQRSSWTTGLPRATSRLRSSRTTRKSTGTVPMMPEYGLGLWQMQAALPDAG